MALESRAGACERALAACGDVEAAAEALLGGGGGGGLAGSPGPGALDAGQQPRAANRRYQTGDAAGALEEYGGCLATARLPRQSPGRGGRARRPRQRAFYHSAGQYQRAVEHHTQALAVSRRSRTGRARAAPRQPRPAYSRLGQYQRAIEHHTQALAISRRSGTVRARAVTSATSATCRGMRRIGRSSTTRRRWHLAGDRGPAGRGQSPRQPRQRVLQPGAVSAGDRAPARRRWPSREIGDRQGEGRSSATSAAYDSLGQYQRAIEHHTQALAISREIGDRQAEGITSATSATRTSAGAYQRAIGHTQALAISREIGDRQGEGNTSTTSATRTTAWGSAEAAGTTGRPSLSLPRSVARWETSASPSLSSSRAHDGLVRTLVAGGRQPCKPWRPQRRACTGTGRCAAQEGRPGRGGGAQRGVGAADTVALTERLRQRSQAAALVYYHRCMEQESADVGGAADATAETEPHFVQQSLKRNGLPLLDELVSCFGQWRGGNREQATPGH